jgi:ribonuclease D
MVLHVTSAALHDRASSRYIAIKGYLIANITWRYPRALALVLFALTDAVGQGVCMSVYLYEEDLPEGVLAAGPVAVDTETMGLITPRDRLCLLQISDGKGDEHLVRFGPDSDYAATNLRAVLADPTRLKLFHFARFDLAAIAHYLQVVATPVFCTKIASRLTRTYTDRHGLKELVKEMLGTDISKQQQSSDWGGPTLSEAQKDYAASDVRYLHRLHTQFVERLEREGRTHLAQACFDFLPHRADLDLAGWPEIDIFGHS